MNDLQMSLRNKLAKGITNPKLAVKWANEQVSFIKRPVTFSISSRFIRGVDLFTLDWDLLIVLDSCRYDALVEVSSNHTFDFLHPDDISPVVSTGNATPEWTTKTFRNDHADIIKQTGLVSANPWPYRVLDQGEKMDNHFNLPSWAPTDWNPVDPGTLGKHIPAWKHTPRDGGRDQTDGATVRDLAIEMGRENNFERVVAHFIEPHWPYSAAARMNGGFTNLTRNPFVYLAEGGSRARVWDAYLTELRYGLEHVETLLKNFDAETVIITADHGDVFGEYWYSGLSAYEHAVCGLHPRSRTVPLTQTTAKDTGNHIPEQKPVDSTATAEDTLRQLGYLE